MITEAYVNFETAKLLKEKGFDALCHSYFRKDNPNDIVVVEKVCDANWNDEQYFISRPTFQMAMEWLEERYGVFCVICRPVHLDEHYDESYSYSWNCDGKMGLSIGNGSGFNTLDEAREAAIKYCLSLV